MEIEEKGIEGMQTRLSRHRSWHHILKAVGLVAGLVSVVSCSSTNSQVTSSLNQKESLSADSSLIGQEDMRMTVTINPVPSHLYNQMLQQGNYSDAAIFQSLQEFMPRPTSFSPMVTNLPDTPQQFLLPDLSYSVSTTNTTLGANWHTKVGWTFVLDGNYLAAEAAYRQALRHETELAEAYLGLGMALMFQGKREQAIMAYEEALNIQPSYPAALVHLGYAYADNINDQSESRIKARSLFQQASDLGDPFALLALMGLKENEEGI